MNEAILLTDRALIAVTGPDWRPFLQGLLSQDVETLQAGALRYAAMLSPQGRILFDLFLLGSEDGCLLDAPADGRDSLIQLLKMYRLRAKVEITPDGRSIAARVDESAGDGWITDPRLPALGWRGYGLGGSATLDRYDAHRWALGVPGPADWGVDRLYALEADLDLLNAINFQKGCFIGQEIASRMKRRGQIKSRTLPVTFDGPAPLPGTEIRARDHRVGEILSGRDGRALALLRLDRIDGGGLTAEGLTLIVERPAWMGQ